MLKRLEKMYRFWDKKVEEIIILVQVLRRKVEVLEKNE